MPPRDTVLERAAAILEQFEDTSTRLRLTAVAQRTHLPISTTHRLVESMVALDWLRRTPEGIALGAGSGRLVRTDDTPYLELRGAAVPHLYRLHRRTGLLVNLVVLEGQRALYLDALGGWPGTPRPPQLGSRLPAYRVVPGRALLSGIAIDDLDGLLPKIGERGPDRRALRTEIDKIRRRGGIALDEGKLLPGVTTVAVRTDTDYARAAIALSGPVAQVRPEDVAPLLLEASARISGRADAPSESTRTDSVEVVEQRRQMLALLRMMQRDDWV